MKKRVPFLVRILLSLVSFVLCVALFVTGIVAILLANVRVLTTEENLQLVIQQVMFGQTEEKPEIPATAPQAIGGMRLEDETTGMPNAQDQIIDMLYEMFAAQFPEGEAPITKEDVGEVLERSTLPEFLSDKMAGVMLDVFNGEFTTTITGAEVAAELEKNKELIQEVFGFELPQETIDEIVTWVDQQDVVGTIQAVILGEAAGEPGQTPEGENTANNALFADGVLNALLSGNATLEDVFNGGLPVILQLLREVTSAEMLKTVLIACAILAALLLVVNIAQIHIGLRKLGITAMLASLPFAASTVASFAVPAIFRGGLSLASLTLSMTAGISLGVFLAGVALLVVSCFMTASYNATHE